MASAGSSWGDWSSASSASGDWSESSACVSGDWSSACVSGESDGCEIKNSFRKMRAKIERIWNALHGMRHDVRFNIICSRDKRGQSSH